jgi:hypothetical protein
MPTIRIHVDQEEMAALKRRAEAHGVSVAQLAYGALNCSMTHCKEAYCTDRIKEAIQGQGKDLPPWSDTARSVSIYEGKPDLGSERGPKAAD